MNYRGRKIKELGVEQYLQRNAEYAKKYRSEHQEMMQNLYNKQKMDPIHKYNYYKYRALKAEIQFELSFEQCFKIFNSDCFYCGEKPNSETLNGIDRMINSEDYLENNCVSCCQMCNYIKNCLDTEIFINRIKHILTHLKIINGNAYPLLFANHKGSSYNSYKKKSRR